MKRYLIFTLALVVTCFADKPTKNERLDSGISKGILSLVKQALDDGATIEKRDPFGRTPLINAAWAGREDIVALLLLRGANVNAKDKLGSTALHKAVRSGNTAAVILLLSEGADIDAQTKEGRTPLHVAANLNKPAMIRLLIRSGADTTLKDNQGRTPEQLATAEHMHDAIKMFNTLKEAPPTPTRKRKRVYDVVSILRKKSPQAQAA